MPESAARPFPSALPVRRGDRRLPDRGRRPRGRPPRLDLGRLLPRSRRGDQRRQRRRRVRPLPPLPRRRRADEVDRAADVPLLDVVVARAAGRRRGQPRRASTSTSASSTSCWTPTSCRGSRCTTGTCRRRWRSKGGWTNRDTADRFTEYALDMHDALGDRVNVLDDAQRAVVLVVPELHRRRARARATTAKTEGMLAAHHLLLGHGQAVRELRARDSIAEPRASRSTSPSPIRSTPTDPADSTPRAASTVSSTAGSSTRSSAAQYPAGHLRRDRAMTRLRRGDPARRPRDHLDAASTRSA